MLQVLPLEDANKLLEQHFITILPTETVPLSDALYRTLSEDLKSPAYVPDFTRSTVDGYAVRAADTFGCSEAIPALLRCIGSIEMGQAASFSLSAGECAYVPTGGALPEGADAMVMVEYTEPLAGGLIAIQKPSAPAAHLIFRGDDVKPEDPIFPRGTLLQPQHIGLLAALGMTGIPVYQKPRVAVLSTGDEIVPPETASLAMGQMRDVNGPLLTAALCDCGAVPLPCGIVPDNPAILKEAIQNAFKQADVVLFSGGSSVGTRDAAASVLENLGDVLFHGIAIKPGKPTLAAMVQGKPVLCLPGHPVAVHFLFSLLVKPMLLRMMGRKESFMTLSAVCTVAIPSNHGREECIAVRLTDGKAVPLMGKSGLISTLCHADGYLRIPRNTEGIAAGETVQVTLL